MSRVDVIVAVRDEELSIPLFLRAVAALPIPDGVDLRVMFVEDSSTDGTRALLRRLSREDPRVSYYSLVGGFGQNLALTFGLSRSTADATILMDVDGSHPIDAIPEMIQGFLGGAQVVQCVRRTFTNRKRYRRLASSAYHIGVRLLTGFAAADQNTLFRLISADFARRLLQQPQYWSYLRFPLPRRPEGALRTVHVDTRERTVGVSKYGFWRLFSLAVDGMLAQMSPGRLTVLMAALATIVLALAVGPGRPLAAVPLLALGWLVRRWRRVRRPVALEQLQIVETSFS